jgi:NRAMP (natural resistance-associated macrophage protein)-like metal ion transporter
MSKAEQPVVEAPRTQEVKAERNPFKRILKLLGPGLITGASDDDPSGIGTYAQAGAQLGYTTLWVALITFPLMATVQYICAKIGLVSGKGLSGILRQHYPRWVFYMAVLVLFVANIINVGADLGAIAAAIHLLVPQIPTWAAIIPVTALLVMALIEFSHEQLAAIFKWLTLALFAYIATAFFTHANWAEVLKNTLVPSIDFQPKSLAVYVGLLGTTISPYLFFWQSHAEVEEQRKAGHTLWRRVGASDDDLKYCAADVNAGMLFSNVVMFFIILTTGATLHQSNIRHIDTAAQAAQALAPLCGPYAKFLFAAGLIGTGLLAVPVLAGSCAYAVASAFGWRSGLGEKWYRAKGFYAVIALACVIGMALNFININPMDALFWTAVLNGILAPPLLVMIMLVSNNPKIMGGRVNSPLLNVLGWSTTVLMFVAAAALIITSV